MEGVIYAGYGDINNSKSKGGGDLFSMCPDNTGDLHAEVEGGKSMEGWRVEESTGNSNEKRKRRGGEEYGMWSCLQGV